MTDLIGLLIATGCLILIEALALFAYWLWGRYDDRRHARMIVALFDAEIERIEQRALDQSGVSRACGGDS